MLVTMQNSELINKLLLIANGDIDLVRDAIDASAGPAGAADLKQVVEYIVSHRRKTAQRSPERVPAVA